MTNNRPIRPSAINDRNTHNEKDASRIKATNGATQSRTLCEFCKSRVATEQVARWDTWTNRHWSIPACSTCAPKNQQTWLT